MSACEKCWSDAGGDSAEYHRLMGVRKCTPEEQAGPAAGICPICRRRTLHQYSHEAMCKCRVETGLKAAIIKGEHTKGRAFEWLGYIVPDTEDLLAVDERYPGVEPDEQEGTGAEEPVWKITHMPTMFSVSYLDYTAASSREQAFAIAQRFYQQAALEGMDLHSTEPTAITDVHKKWDDAKKQAFWSAVKGDSVSREPYQS